MPYAHTLAAACTGDYQEKGSKFLAYAFPCANEAQFAAQLHQQKQAHPKARHHCYAWRFGEHGQHYRANDDGEPSGTAGLPIYNQLQSFDVSDCGLIVVRYFGGTLLGAAGLIRAYKTAAQAALKTATLQPIVPKAEFIALPDYAQIHRLMQIVEQQHLEILAQEMALTCRFHLRGERDQLAAIRAQLHSLSIPTQEYHHE